MKASGNLNREESWCSGNQGSGANSLAPWSNLIGMFSYSLIRPCHRRSHDLFFSRLIMDGPLLLTRVVRKAVVSFDTINSHGDATTVQVDCLAPELTPRPLIGILCNDLLVLCRDPSEGQDPSSQVDLWAVLRMQTLPQPASIVHGNGKRILRVESEDGTDGSRVSQHCAWWIIKLSCILTRLLPRTR